MHEGHAHADIMTVQPLLFPRISSWKQPAAYDQEVLFSGKLSLRFMYFTSVIFSSSGLGCGGSRAISVPDIPTNTFLLLGAHSTHS